MTLSSARLATCTPEASRSCSASRPVRSSRSLSPMTPLSGVRISWLIVARNSDFCREASIASSRAAASSASARSRSATRPSWTATCSTIDRDHVVAVQRGRRGDRDDRAHLVAEGDREGDGEPGVVPHGGALAERPVGQRELVRAMVSGVVGVGGPVLVGDVQRDDAAGRRAAGRKPRARSQSSWSSTSDRAWPRTSSSASGLVGGRPATACRRAFWANESSSASSACFASVMSWWVPEIEHGGPGVVPHAHPSAPGPDPVVLALDAGHEHELVGAGEGRLDRVVDPGPVVGVHHVEEVGVGPAERLALAAVEGVQLVGARDGAGDQVPVVAADPGDPLGLGQLLPAPREVVDDRAARAVVADPVQDAGQGAVRGAQRALAQEHPARGPVPSYELDLDVAWC